MESNEASWRGSRISESSFTIKVHPEVEGVRLDQFLSQLLVSHSRTLITNSIRSGLISVNGILKKNSYRLKQGEVVSGSLAEPSPIEVQPEKIDFSILYEDDFLLVISKPPGLVVHPGSGNHTGTLVNGLVYYCQSIAAAGDSLRPGIVHRLDKDTSGIMVVAKQDEVHRRLVDLFKKRQIEKEYLTLVHGILKEKKGRIVAAIGRHPVHRQKMAVRLGNGRHAVSNWQVLQQFEGKRSLLRVNIETGRTHQIRVHMAHLGHPVVGDTVYGLNRLDDNVSRQLLHASRLAFQHPVSGKRLDITAPLWQDFSSLLRSMGWGGRPGELM